MLKQVATAAIALGLRSPAQAQTARLASEDLSVSFGGGQIFVRKERPDGVATVANDRIVLFVHGATYPRHGL
jgi:hypothetical protein